MVTETIIEGKHDRDFFMPLTPIPQFSWRKNLKMLLEENNVLFKYRPIQRVSITFLRDAVI
jgi:hypothetical protein